MEKENGVVHWTSLEAAKFGASISTPILVAFFGWVINRRLRAIDQIQWQNRKIIERRIELFDDIAPLMNRVFCFCRWWGYWADITPDDMLQAKRELDKTINIYRHLLGEEFYENYMDFIRITFKTYTRPGEDAKILAAIQGENGNRKIHGNYQWNPKWDKYFLERRAASYDELTSAYEQAMSSLKTGIGLD